MPMTTRCPVPTAASAIMGASVLACGPALGEVIAPDQSELVVTPGSQTSVHWTLSANATPIFGYSLDLNLVSSPEIGGGGVVIDPSASSFFDERNVIAAGGAARDPFFSVIEADGSGGAFVSTNTDDASTVQAVEGVNDVLFEMVVDIAPDAAPGDYTYELGGGTALSDADGFAIPFTGNALEITVVPAPGAVWMLVCGACAAARQRRKIIAHA